VDDLQLYKNSGLKQFSQLALERDPSHAEGAQTIVVRNEGKASRPLVGKINTRIATKLGEKLLFVRMYVRVCCVCE
jgi:hypothetical protein